MTKNAVPLSLLKKNPRFAKLIKKYGAPDLTLYHGKMRVFSALLRSIIYQQLSGKAAGAIHARLLALFPKSGPTPKLLSKIRAPKLRAAGLSVQKITYVRDLAKKFIDGTINEKEFSKMSSQDIIDHLVQVKGIGEWSAQMLLIFTLYRPDILPTGDLAIQKGFQMLYGLKARPSKKQMEKLAAPWRLEATAGSWYLWRVADEAKSTPVTRGGVKKNK